jgi:hypothetical protein
MAMVRRQPTSLDDRGIGCPPLFVTGRGDGNLGRKTAELLISSIEAPDPKFPNLYNQTNKKTRTPSQSDSDEVDVPSFDVRTYKLYSHLVSDVEATLACHHFPFDRRLKEPHPRASF